MAPSTARSDSPTALAARDLACTALHAEIQRQMNDKTLQSKAKPGTLRLEMSLLVDIVLAVTCPPIHRPEFIMEEIG